MGTNSRVSSIRLRDGKLLPEYCAWANMKSRCLNSRRPDFRYYGGRGITVCRPWIDSFNTFLADMGKRPSDKHTIERREVNGNYSPENCYWANRTIQARNRRSSVKIIAFGKALTVPEWSELMNINPGTIKSRLQRRWTPEKALTCHLQTTSERRALVSKLAVIRWAKEKKHAAT